MAKLYWRVKRDGKWIMTPARVTFMDTTRVQVAYPEDDGLIQTTLPLGKSS